MAKETQNKDQWVLRNLAPQSPVPFSFRYGGQASKNLLPGWTPKVQTVALDACRTEHTRVWTEPRTGFEIRCVAIDYNDFPAVEWILHFTNPGTSDSPLIEDIRALDIWLPEDGKGFVLHRSLGENNSAQSFAPVDEPLPPQDFQERVFAPRGGRSSDGNMPYFNVDWRSGGLILAIGWSGQWEAGFQQLAEGGLRVRAGQQLTHFKLRAGETARSPRIVLAFWGGEDDLRGNNIFRQLVLKHYAPQRKGRPVFPPLCATVNYTAPDGTYEKPHLDAIPTFKELGFEVLWSDMDPQQWYPGGFPTGTGTWEVDLSKYPNGLKPLGDACRAAKLGYLLWFEPERVHPGTKIDREHPEWIMKREGQWSQLFRLHDPAARQWLTECIDAHVAEAQLTWLRWDFNIEPLEFWRQNDAPDRQGMTEIRHMEGLYAMWAELQKRHPGLLIDNCSSGGRRLDIEASRFGLPLWHSDMQCCGKSNPTPDQLQNGGLNRWIPLHGCGLFALEPDYGFRSAMTAGNVILAKECLSSTQTLEAKRAIQRTLALYRKIRPYLLGDFYPLFPHSADETLWYGHQFHRPDLDEGLVQVFRRQDSPYTHADLKLRGLTANAIYRIVDLDRPRRKCELSGKDLMETGLSVNADHAPQARVLVYRRGSDPKGTGGLT